MRSGQLLAMLTALGAWLLPGPPTAAAGGVPWGTDPGAAFRQAREANRPVLVQVIANPCGSRATIGIPGEVHETDCQKLELVTLSRPEFAAAATKFVPLLFNATAGSTLGAGAGGHELFRSWKVATVPTLLIADPWANEIIRLVGVTPLDKALRVLNAIPADLGALRPAGEALQGDPEALPALLAAAAFYEGAGLRPVAERYYERAAESPAAGADAAARRGVVIARGLNLLHMNQAKQASKLFSDEAGRGEGPQHEVVLFGWALASLATGDKREAERILADLEKRFPGSPYTAKLKTHLGR